MFRTSLVGGLGYCANDRKREPLNGSEQRSCWTASATATTGGFFDAPLAPDNLPLERGLHEVS
jgi:hypothetical protein